MQDYNAMIEAIQRIVNFASYFIFSFAGSLLKEMYNTNSNNKYSFEPYKVVISTFVATLIAIAAKEYYSEILDQYWGVMGIISLILGFTGFELFRYISSIRGIRKIIGVVHQGDDDMLDKIDEVLDDEDKKEKESEPFKKPVVNGPIARTLHPDGKLIGYKISKPVIHNPEDNNIDKK